MSDDNQLKALQKQARDLGVEVDNRWKEARLQQEIEAAQSAAPDAPNDDQGAGGEDPPAPEGGEGDLQNPANPDDGTGDDPDEGDEDEPEEDDDDEDAAADQGAILNVSKTVQYVYGVRLVPGGKHELTEADKRDTNRGKRVDRGVSLELLKRV